MSIGSSGTTTSIKKVSGNLTLSCSTNPANFENLYVTGNVDLSGSCIFNVDALHVGGTLTISGSGVLNLDGMSYVGGNIALSGSGKIKLDSSLGANTGYLISDGNMNISGSGALSGSGTTGSYIMMITTSTSMGTPGAITVSGGGSAALLVAPYGQVNFQSGAINGIVAKMTNITGGTLTYQSYLNSMVFGGTAYGAWNVLNWNEVSN